MSSFFLFQLTFRIDIQRAKLIVDNLIDFIDPWHEDDYMYEGIIGIDMPVAGPPNAIVRVDDDIKSFFDYLLPNNIYVLSDVIYRSYGSATENEPHYTLFGYVIYEWTDGVFIPSLRRRALFNFSDFQ